MPWFLLYDLLLCSDGHGNAVMVRENPLARLLSFQRSLDLLRGQDAVHLEDASGNGPRNHLFRKWARFYWLEGEGGRGKD